MDSFDNMDQQNSLPFNLNRWGAKWPKYIKCKVNFDFWRKTTDEAQVEGHVVWNIVKPHWSHILVVRLKTGAHSTLLAAGTTAALQLLAVASTALEFGDKLLQQNFKKSQKKPHLDWARPIRRERTYLFERTLPDPVAGRLRSSALQVQILLWFRNTLQLTPLSLWKFLDFGTLILKPDFSSVIEQVQKSHFVFELTDSRRSR